MCCSFAIVIITMHQMCPYHGSSTNIVIFVPSVDAVNDACTTGVSLMGSLSLHVGFRKGDVLLLVFVYTGMAALFVE